MDSSPSRPLTVEERRALARLSSPGAAMGNVLVSTAFVFLLVFGGSTAIARVFFGPPQGERLAWLAGLAGAVALWSLMAMLRGPARILSAERERLARDLAGGQASVTTYEAVDALRVEELEDEGSAYYLKLADGRVLFLSGQYLYDDEEEGTFPCRRFTLERAPESRLLLGLIPAGPPLPPSGSLPAFTPEQHRAGLVPADGDVLALDFERLRPQRAG